MGKPIANKDFILALLTHGTLDSCRFYYLDEEDLVEGRAGLEESLTVDKRASSFKGSGFSSTAKTARPS